jgi:hypothetical protein
MKRRGGSECIEKEKTSEAQKVRKQKNSAFKASSIAKATARSSLYDLCSYPALGADYTSDFVCDFMCDLHANGHEIAHTICSRSHMKSHTKSLV